MAHKFYRIAGGVDKYFVDLCQLMNQHNHKVIPFATQNEDNLPSPYEKYFAPNVQYGNQSIIQQIKNVSSFIYSFEAKNQISELLKKEQPHVAHFQHVYHQLTTSVFEPLNEKGIPIVQGVHDYKLGCPRYMLFNTATNELCDKCQGKNYYQVLLNRCYDGSLFNSTLLAVESYYNQLFKTYQRNVSRFLVSNEHMKGRLTRYGIDKEKIVVIPNFVDVAAYKPIYEHDGYFLYFGRLSIEKGVEYALRAMVQLPDQKLVIVGNGPDESRLRKLANDLNLNNVQFLGPLWGEALQPILDRAISVIVPSYWHENSPMVIYQSFASAKPVIGSRRGGIPDLVDEDVNGLLFEAGNIEELTHCMNEIALHREKQKYFSIQARLKAENEFTPELHYSRIMQVYSDVGVFDKS